MNQLNQVNQKKNNFVRRNDFIWCQICQKKHPDPKNDTKIRKKVVLGSSTLAHLWKTDGFKQNCDFHIDFDCIIGGQIHDVHLSFLRQYMDNISNPLDIVLGMISHKKSLLTIICHKHKIKNFIKKFDIFH